MKFYTILLALASTVAAQSASIGTPVADSSVAAGTNVTIMIVKPNSQSPSTDVAIVIGVLPCSNGACPSSELGTILYTGPFNPTYATPPGSLPPHQNFSVQVPSDFAAGSAQIGVAHLYLVGAVPSPVLETFNTTVQVMTSTDGSSASGSSTSRRSMRIMGNQMLR